MLNEEQILDICLKFVSTDIRNLDYGHVKEFLVWYVVKNNPNITEDDIMDKIVEYIYHHASSEMLNDSSLEVSFNENGEVEYVMGEKFYQNTYKELITTYSNLTLDQDEILSKMAELWEQMPDSDRHALVEAGFPSPETIVADR